MTIPLSVFGRIQNTWFWLHWYESWQEKAQEPTVVKQIIIKEDTLKNNLKGE